MATLYGIVAVPPHSRGDFFSGGSYIVRWTYDTWAKGLKPLAHYGATPDRTGIGRSECLDFVWIGNDSAIDCQLTSSFLPGKGRRITVFQVKLTMNGVRKMSIDETGSAN